MDTDILESVKESLPTEGEKNLLIDLNARHAAECERIKKAGRGASAALSCYPRGASLHRGHLEFQGRGQANRFVRACGYRADCGADRRTGHVRSSGDSA